MCKNQGRTISFLILYRRQVVPLRQVPLVQCTLPQLPASGTVLRITLYKNRLLLFKYNPNSKQLRSKSLKSLLPTCDQLFDRIPDIPEVRKIWFKITQSEEKNTTGVAKIP